MAVADIRISDFDYALPDGRIARHPLPERDRCLLLRCDASGGIEDRRFYELPGLLPAGTLMVCNNTRVINSRLQFRKPTGSLIEVFLLEPETPADYALMFQSRGPVVWKCLVGNLKRWKSGILTRVIEVEGREVTLTARRLTAEPHADNSHSVELSWDDPELHAADVIGAAGRIPIPPYLNRESEQCDSTDYQTVYSKIKGSVAAPTAGLHFTPETLSALDAAGVRREELTLHVGAGTFRPVKSETIGEHPMHTEVFTVTLGLVEMLVDALKSGRHIAAVGTTSVRTLESLPYLGRRLARGLDAGVEQWEAYEAPVADAAEALEQLADYMRGNGKERLTASTAIMIAPGFRWNLVDVMVTNFHQPQSTLLLLVSSFLGDNGTGDVTPRWRTVYDHALAGGYRFLSYGDACLFFAPR